MSIRFPKYCKTKAQKSFHASRMAKTRWDKVHADQMSESIRSTRPIILLSIQRVGIDPVAIPISIIDDGGHRRRAVSENGTPWSGLYGRKPLVKWFNSILKSAGV